MTNSSKPPQKRCLVAGISGPLGRAIARALAAEGFDVSGVSRSAGEYGQWATMAAALPRVNVRKADLSDPAQARRECIGEDAVVFAAGSSGVGASFEDPRGNLFGNAVPWINLLESVSTGTHLVLLSSQLVYGMPGRRAFTEDAPLFPGSPYAIHRVLLEQYGRLYAARRNLRLTILRLGNVFGDVIELNLRRSHGVVPRMLTDLVNTGVAYLYGDGAQRIDLLFAGDLAAAVTRVLEHPVDDGVTEVLNVHGTAITVHDVARALIDGLGYGKTVCVPWEPALADASAKDIILDARRFRTLYGWDPASDVPAELRRLGKEWSRLG